jgi:hypothetical protein
MRNALDLAVLAWNHAVIPGQAAGLNPEPRTDALSCQSTELEELFWNSHRFWVPGSSLREAPE